MRFISYTIGYQGETKYSVEVHPQLSNNRNPVEYDALVGASSL
jgi:hypothetical protein